MKSSVRELDSPAKTGSRSFKNDPNAIISCTVPLRSAGSVKLYYCDTLDYLRSLPDKSVLRAFVPPRGTVLDRYCGSGTTLVAAENFGMSAIGVDRDQYSLWVAHERIINVNKQQKLFKADTNQLSLSGDKTP